MIDVSTIKAGTILRDTTKKGADESRAYYTVSHRHDTTGLFDVTHCASGALSTLTYEAVEESFVAIGRKVFCDIDLAPLLGKRLRVTTHLGTFTGPLGEIRCHRFTVDGEELQSVKEFIVNGDAIPMAELVSFETL